MNMSLRNSFLLAALLVSGACSSGGAEQSTSAIAAGESVRSQGIQSYVVAGDSISLLDANGALVGTVQISAPTSDSRLVSIVNAEGQGAEHEITRPVAGLFKVPVEGLSREDAVLLDPALASTFASHQLTFGTLGNRIPAPLGTESLGNCDGISWNYANTGCTKCGNMCDLVYYSDGIDSIASAWCPLVSCQYAMAYCPGLGYSVQDYDGVQKHQRCYNSGSCDAQQPIGYMQCMSLINGACTWEY